MDPSEKNVRRLKVFIIGVIFIIILLTIFIIYKNSLFRVTNTNPSINNMSTITPDIIINFNRNLSTHNIILSSIPKIITSYKVSGQYLQVNLKTPTNIQTSYSLIINSISDNKGTTLHNIHLSFIPQTIPFNQLPKNQQNMILKQQSTKTSKNTVIYQGTNQLINNGVTSRQVKDYIKAISLFGQQNHILISAVSIIPSSVTSPPYTPGQNPYVINFNININNTPYKATFNYYSNLVSAQLLLFNPTTNKQVFNSGILTTQKTN